MIDRVQRDALSGYERCFAWLQAVRAAKETISNTGAVKKAAYAAHLQSVEHELMSVVMPLVLEACRTNLDDEQRRVLGMITDGHGKFWDDGLDPEADLDTIQKHAAIFLPSMNTYVARDLAVFRASIDMYIKTCDAFGDKALDDSWQGSRTPSS